MADDCSENKQLAHDIGLADLRELNEAKPNRSRKCAEEQEPDEGHPEYEEELRAAAHKEIGQPAGSAAKSDQEEPECDMKMADAELLPDAPITYSTVYAADCQQ